MQPIDILLVEDNEGDILLTTETLKDQKIIKDIHVVKNGYEAINFLLKRDAFINSPTPHLVLLDINLPKLNGQEVLKLIRSYKQIRDIPVVMLSTSSSPEDVLESLKNEASCYITKPLDFDDFVKKISFITELEISSENLSNS